MEGMGGIGRGVGIVTEGGVRIRVLKKGKLEIVSRNQWVVHYPGFKNHQLRAENVNQPPTWNTGMPGAYPVDEVSHWPRSGGLQFQKALVPHLKKKDPAPNNMSPVREDSLRREANGEATERGHAPGDSGPESHLSLRHLMIMCLHDDLSAT